MIIYWRVRASLPCYARTNVRCRAPLPWRSLSLSLSLSDRVVSTVLYDRDQNRTSPVLTSCHWRSSVANDDDDDDDDDDYLAAFSSSSRSSGSTSPAAVCLSVCFTDRSWRYTTPLLEVYAHPVAAARSTGPPAGRRPSDFPATTYGGLRSSVPSLMAKQQQQHQQQRGHGSAVRYLPYLCRWWLVAAAALQWSEKQ